MRLSLLAILLGAGLSVPQVYGLASPEKFAKAARRFPRNMAAGIFLMLLGTVWFAWNVLIEPVADFSVFKPYMIAAFIAIGFFSCIYVRDFLAVRGLAVVALLLAKLMVDTGRPHLGQSPWVLLIQYWAYLLVALGIWFTITPWRLRDFLNWATQTKARVLVGCLLRLAFALFVIYLGLTAFRAM
ncbi:MAG TPA: hypothetical protein VGI03_09950 [Verrucomicrobiae bacterium]|jgi:hypothetical protein